MLTPLRSLEGRAESEAQQQTLLRQSDRNPLTPPPPTNQPTRPQGEAEDLQLCLLQTNPYITNPNGFLSLKVFINVL